MNLISIDELSKSDILDLFKRADYFRTKKFTKKDRSKITGLLFFEPSTRTRVGFEVAAWKLGYKSVVLNETKPSVSKGWSESMSDTIKIMNAFVDLYFIRHPDPEIFKQVLPFTQNPVVNCGNGYDEHPTQALIDAYAIWVKFNRLDNLTITFIGETKYSRATHSLVKLLSKFDNIHFQEITPKALSLSGITNITKSELGKEDILYSCGFPPINPSGHFSQSIVRKYIVTKNDVDKLKKDCIIMNPLPRIDEIDTEVDSDPRAYYFKQNELGLFMRMAVVEMISKS